MRIRNVAAICRRDAFVALTSAGTWIAFSVIALVSGLILIALLARYMFAVAHLPESEGGLAFEPFVIEPYFQWLLIALAALIPSFTMRAIAEERRFGTFEALVTAPVSEYEIVLAKYLALATLLLPLLAISAVGPALLIFIVPAEPGSVLSGFIGLALAALAFSSLGLATSSFCQNPYVAALLALLLNAMLLVAHLPGPSLGSEFEAFCNAASATKIAYPMFAGVVSLHGIAYFAVLVVAGLFLSRQGLDVNR